MPHDFLRTAGPGRGSTPTFRSAAICRAAAVAAVATLGVSACATGEGDRYKPAVSVSSTPGGSETGAASPASTDPETSSGTSKIPRGMENYDPRAIERFNLMSSDEFILNATPGKIAETCKIKEPDLDMTSDSPMTKTWLEHYAAMNAAIMRVGMSEKVLGDAFLAEPDKLGPQYAERLQLNCVPSMLPLEGDGIVTKSRATTITRSLNNLRWYKEGMYTQKPEVNYWVDTSATKINQLGAATAPAHFRESLSPEMYEEGYEKGSFDCEIQISGLTAQADGSVKPSSYSETNCVEIE